MICNTLQHKNPQANLQKIIDPTKESVISNPQEIHSFIEDYYTKLYNNNSSTDLQKDIPTNWSSQYYPIYQSKQNGMTTSSLKSLQLKFKIQSPTYLTTKLPVPLKFQMI